MGARPSITVAAVIERGGRFLLVEEEDEGRILFNQPAGALRQLLAQAGDAGAERAAISLAIGRMYAIAGEQTPVWRDKGRNYADGGVDGQMDCIDHSANTDAFLRLLQAHGWLRFHQVLEPIRRVRFFVALHWAGRIRERETQQAYAVDSWYFDNGRPAAVLTVEDWRAGKTPDGA